MKNTDVIYLSVSDLNYNGTTTAQKITRADFFRVVRWDGRYLKERIGPTQYKRIKSDEHSRAYSLAIQKKYNVGKDWKQNRWFVEQVRPTLN